MIRLTLLQDHAGMNRALLLNDKVVEFVFKFRADITSLGLESLAYSLFSALKDYSYTGVQLRKISYSGTIEDKETAIRVVQEHDHTGSELDEVFEKVDEAFEKANRALDEAFKSHGESFKRLERSFESVHSPLTETEEEVTREETMVRSKRTGFWRNLWKKMVG